MRTLIVDNSAQRALDYERAGIDCIFIDLEINGKEKRQGHLDTVISHHKLTDIRPVKSALTTSSVLVRVNPLNDNSLEEINAVIAEGADIIMLPMFKTVAEVQKFVQIVAGRAKVSLLLETAESLARLDSILELKGIDEVHIGLNDLHLALGLSFMFELMAGGLVEYLSFKLKKAGVPFGVGGVARMDEGALPGRVVIAEHARIGSTSVILSRTFKQSTDDISKGLEAEVNKLQDTYSRANSASKEELQENHTYLRACVEAVVSKAQL